MERVVWLVEKGLDRQTHFAQISPEIQVCLADPIEMKEIEGSEAGFRLVG